MQGGFHVAKNSRSPVPLLLALLVAGAADLGAQSNAGRISGTVTDSSGAVLPGVAVTVSQQGTGLSRTVPTDAAGAYLFVSLPVGTYDVSGISEVVEVSVHGETVNTVSGEIARVVDREQVQNLALNGRQYLQLATLIPGAPLLDDNAINIMTGLAINTSVNGSRTNTSLLTVDGGFNMDSGSNNSQISNVGIDFIEEVSIKTANFSAEYGRNSGGNINVVTRSGTNDFHGSAFEYHRNNGLDANDYFNNSRGVDKARLRFNDFGYSLGGPIQKNN